MLDLEDVDLDELAMALEDHSPDHAWWIDPRTGELMLSSDGDDESDGLVFVEPVDPRESYADMEDFISRVADSRARELLERAIAGRGAFRRFKDALLEFPEVRDAWFAFHDARMCGRTIEWLAREGLVDQAVADRALADSPEPGVDVLKGAFDATEIARAVAQDLSELYGDRLHAVVLFGSWARGEAHAESDVDLLVVLDQVRSRRAELARMSDILWRHSLANDTVVTEIPVSRSEYRDADAPLIVRARSEGVLVT